MTPLAPRMLRQVALSCLASMLFPLLAHAQAPSANEGGEYDEAEGGEYVDDEKEPAPGNPPAGKPKADEE